MKSADIIIITFEFQKNDWRYHSVHLWRTDDPLLCPVKAGAKIVKEIWSYPECTEEFKINTLLTEDGTITNINSAQVLPHLRSIVDLIGETSLGFKSKDIGLHSIRSGGAMAMFLSGISTIIIQRIGRWSSEAFLEYIREQVESFSFGVTKKMLLFEHFHTINTDDESLNEKEELDDIFIENKGNGQPPVAIEHQIEFSKLSLENNLVMSH